MATKQLGQTVLSVQDLHLSFGRLMAIDGVSFDVTEHELLAIIGPNGAGKTCILNCINGFYHCDSGKIFYQTREITNLQPHEMVKIGISRVFQQIQLYSGLSTLDNLMAARYAHMKYGILASMVYFGKAQREEIYHRKEVERVIDFLEIEPVRKQLVGILPYGMRKRVDLGRALAAKPRLLLLDEPMAGMNLDEKRDMVRFILSAQKEQELTIVMVEHDMEVVMDIADKVIVLDFGRLIARGTPEEIRVNPKVIEAYLGTEGIKRNTE